MSDYKNVNGKKVRVCKYGCQTDLTWSEAAGIFIEEDGTLHTKERCKQVKESKQPKPKQEPPTQQAKQQFTLEAVMKKLESIGMKIDLDKLMNSK